MIVIYALSIDFVATRMSCRGCIIDAVIDRGMHANFGLYGYDAASSRPHEIDFELFKCTEDCGSRFIDPDTKRLLRMSTSTAVFLDGRLEFHSILGEIIHFQKEGELTLRGMAAMQVRQNLIHWLNRQKLTRYHFWDFLLAQIELESLGVPFNLVNSHDLQTYVPPTCSIHLGTCAICLTNDVVPHTPISCGHVVYCNSCLYVCFMPVKVVTEYGNYYTPASPPPPPMSPTDLMTSLPPTVV